MELTSRVKRKAIMMTMQKKQKQYYFSKKLIFQHMVASFLKVRFLSFMYIPHLFILPGSVTGNITISDLCVFSFETEGS